MKAIVRIDRDLAFKIELLMDCDRYEIVQAESTISAFIDCYIRQWDLDKSSMAGLLFMDTDGSFARMESYRDEMGSRWECIMFNGQIYALCGLD